MKGYSKKVLVGVSFASLLLGSFQGSISAENTKEEQVSYRNVLKMEPVGVQFPVQELAHSSKVLENKSFEKGYNLLIYRKDRQKSKKKVNN